MDNQEKDMCGGGRVGGWGEGDIGLCNTNMRTIYLHSCKPVVCTVVSSKNLDPLHQIGGWMHLWPAKNQAGH